MKRRSDCALSCALEIIGDKWSMLILRDAIAHDKKFFKDFMQSDEKISTNILADRLALLTRHKILRKQKDKNNKLQYRYMLTEKGKGLLPAMLELAKWCQKHYRGLKEVGA